MSIYDTLITKVSPAAIKQSASTAALGNYGEQQTYIKARRKRFDQLSALIDQGQITSAQLGPNDRTLMTQGIASLSPAAGFKGPTADPSGGVFKGIGGFFGNFAKDIGNTGLYLVPGLIKAVGSVAKDTIHNFENPTHPRTLFSDQSAIRKDIIDPTIQNYKDVYGPGGGSFWENFYQHPLGPVLDAATLASGGLAGAARVGNIAARTGRLGGEAGAIGRARQFTSREGRPPIETSTGRKIPRTYTPRPLSRLGQRYVLDPIAERIPVMGNLQRRMEERRLSRGAQADSQHERFSTIAELATGSKIFGQLSPDEQQALFLTQLGINTPRRTAAFEDMVHRASLDDPVELYRLEAEGIDKRYLQHQANLPEKVKQLIIDPSDAMIEGHRVWKGIVDQLRIANAVDPEMATRHIAEPQRILDEHLRAMARDFKSDTGLKVRPTKAQPVVPHDLYPIQPTYVPLGRAAGFEPAGGFRRPDNLFERTGSGKLGRAVGFGGRPGHRDAATMRTGFVVQPQRFMHESQFETFRAGTFRTDTRAMIDHITQRAKSVADEHFKLNSLERIAAKDPETGALFKTKASSASQLTREELETLQKAGVDLNDVEFVNDGFMVQWFMKEIDHLHKVKDIINTFTKDLPEEADLTNIFADPQMEKILEQVTDADAKAFVTTAWNAAKTKNYVVPKADAKYMMKISNLDLPHANAGMRFFGTWMNRWRNFVLTYMPRWWLNTAAGSFLMNVVQGVNLHDYMLGHRMMKSGDLPGKVNLGHQPLVEYQEAAAQMGRQMQMTVPTKMFQGMVQGIENYFRRGAFVHQLKREHRLTRDHKNEPVDPEEAQSQAMVDLGDTLQTQYEELLGKYGGNIADALSNPQTVAHALQEVDKFSYNYSILGPSERRYVRQFVPFWGWYKFISMAAYRLPVEMPGRVNVMRWLSNVAAEEEAGLGSIPPWVEGAIPVSLGGGRYTYLSSLGINPFSSFINPGGRRGLVSGILSPTQLNPALQGLLSAAGYDPLSGGGVRISPESGITTDFLGRLVDENTGQPINLAEHEGGWRLLHSLLFSFPQARTGLSGDTGQFPESIPGIDIPGVGHIPGIHDRPLPGQPDTPAIENISGPFEGSGTIQSIQEKLGLLPLKDYDFRKQRTAQKAAKFARRKNQRARQRNP